MGKSSPANETTAVRAVVDADYAKEFCAGVGSATTGPAVIVEISRKCAVSIAQSLAHAAAGSGSKKGTKGKGAKGKGDIADGGKGGKGDVVVGGKGGKGGKGTLIAGGKGGGQGGGSY